MDILEEEDIKSSTIKDATEKPLQSKIPPTNQELVRNRRTSF